MLLRSRWVPRPEGRARQLRLGGIAVVVLRATTLRVTGVALEAGPVPARSTRRTAHIRCVVRSLDDRQGVRASWPLRHVIGGVVTALAGAGDNDTCMRQRAEVLV